MAKTRTSTRLLVAIALLALPPAWGWWQWKGRGPLRIEASVIVPKGVTIDQMADRLERDGVIRSASLFKLWARARKLKLIRGEYAFDAGASLSDVANKFKRGDIHWTSIIIPTGVHAWSVQHRLEGFVPEPVFWKLWHSRTLARTAGFPEATSLEGLVAPATYRVNHALEPEEILLEMMEAFRHQVFPKLEGGRLDPYETLVLASLVEKETSLEAEQPKVAGVYAKRLASGMKLQCDPTSQYARWMSGDLRFTAPTHEDTVRANPYNTYWAKGLPPTPIAIPGDSSIEAAKKPEITKDLYFVATGTGGHRFAATLREHNKNVNLYRKELARQKGEKDQ